MTGPIDPMPTIKSIVYRELVHPEKVDHAAMVVDFLERAKNALSVDSVSAYAQLALVHQTALLTEQQRIASVIEVAKWNDKALWRGQFRGQFDADIDGAEERVRVDSMFREVREGLGLA